MLMRSCVWGFFFFFFLLKVESETKCQPAIKERKKERESQNIITWCHFPLKKKKAKQKNGSSCHLK